MGTRARAAFRRALLVVNPTSGLALGPRAARAVGRRLEERGVATEIRQTEAPGDAPRWAREAGGEGFEVVVAVGGDGTVQEVVAGMLEAERPVPVAHYPVGSANIIALCLNLPWLPRHAGDVIADGRAIPFDIGWLPRQRRCFVLMASVGYPALIVRDTKRRWKNLFGVLSYLGAGLRNLLSPGHSDFRLETDDRTVTAEGHTVLVANLGQIRQLGLRVAPGTSPHDGRLDVSVIGSRTLWDVLVVLFRLLTLRRSRHPRLLYLHGKHLVVSAEPSAPVQIDGEWIGGTPLVAEVLPGAVRMVVPRSYQADGAEPAGAEAGEAGTGEAETAAGGGGTDGENVNDDDGGADRGAARERESAT